MPDEMITRPTLETVLESIRAVDKKIDQRIDALERKVDERFDQVDARFAKVYERFDQVDARFAKVYERFDQVDIEIDRVASLAYSTKAEMLTLRADFKEMRVQVKEALPVLQES